MTTRTGGLLAVHAHPDDETLATGALLATWAASGAPVCVVTCTRGEQGEVIGSDLAHLEGDGPALAARREGELARALRALGVGRHHFLDQLPSDADDGALPARIVDSGMSWLPGQRTGTAAAAGSVPDGAFVSVDRDAAARRLARLVDELRPDVVVTYDPGGGYGHPDHVRAHEVTMRALELVHMAQPVVLWPSIEPAQLRAQRAALASLDWTRDVARTHGLDLPGPDSDLPAVADAARSIALAVDGHPVLTPVLTALQEHATQVHALVAAPDDAPSGELIACYSLSNDVLAGIGPTETYAWGSAHSADQATHIEWPTGISLSQRFTN